MICSKFISKPWLRPYSAGPQDETNNDSKKTEKVLLPKRILASLPAHENIYTIPNILTFSRLVAAPVIGYFILHEQHVAALGLFIYAGATDLVDGWIARKWKLQTVVGTVIDPMADKTLMTILTVSLAMQGAIPVPLATLILGRDVLLSLAAVYYRYISLPPPKSFARYWDFSLPSAEVHPTGISKINTALQLGLIGWTMGTMAVGGDLGWWGPEGALRAMWTTTTVFSSVTTLPTTTTVAQGTTVTTITAGKNQKRENAATITSTIDVQPQPYGYNYVLSMSSGAERNASIASSVYSACSCLRTTPKTVSTQSTTESTRTITGSDGVTQAAVTVTSGTFTLTVTERSPNYYPYQSYVDSSSSANSSSTRRPLTGSSIPSVTASSISIVLPTFNNSYSTGTGSGPRGGASTSTPSAAINTTLPSVPSLLPSSSTTSSLRPVGTSINPAGCPTENNTIYTTSNGQQYQLQCYRVYGGPVSIGLDQPYFRNCIDQCSLVNAGFSAIRCFGVTWLQYDEGIHCNLKGQSALSNYTTSILAVSAVLLTGVQPPIIGQFKGSLGLGAAAGGEVAEGSTDLAGAKTQLLDDESLTRRKRVVKALKKARDLWKRRDDV
ncbi:MAG: hypothetical protein Q9213_000123 [Squamulea squamosa]